MTEAAKMELILLTAGVFIIISVLNMEMTLGSRVEEEELNDVNLTSIEIIQKYGYPVETHTTESEDGYILTLHRIPHGKKSRNPGFPILVQHGLVADSSCFLLTGTNSPAFILADEGFDVWLSNLRGNPYTRSHKYLHPNDTKFWDFSWHELGLYDLPAYINYVCNYTQNPDILFLAHSMGSTGLFVMASERPEYQKKIRGAVILGPVATLKYLTSPFRILAPFTKLLQALVEKFTHGEINVQSLEYQNFVKALSRYPIIQQLFVKNLIFLLTGFDYRGFEEKALPNILSHYPSITSGKTIAHYGQVLNSGKFRQYDYGAIKNLRKYNQLSPPEYELERITVPMCLFVGYNDIFATPKDVMLTLSGLPGIKGIYFVPRHRFTHLDFLVGKNLTEVLYRSVSERLNFLMNQG